MGSVSTSREIRTVHFKDRELTVSEETADIAALLLDMTQGTDLVRRDVLRDAWGREAHDLRTYQTRERARAKGNISSHVLKNGLSFLERDGAARRIGDSSHQAVVVLDRELLAAIADSWD